MYKGKNILFIYLFRKNIFLNLRVELILKAAPNS